MNQSSKHCQLTGRVVRGFLAGMAAALIATGAGGAQPASGARAVLPAPVTLTGIAGVKPRMGIAEIRHSWGMQLPYYDRTSGSSLRGGAIVCAGAMKGVATFWAGGLQFVEFTDGAKTDAHVGTGSSLAQLRRAYGRALMGSLPDFYVIAKTPLPRIAIHFLVPENRVRVVVWGVHGEIKGSDVLYSKLVRVIC